MSSARMKARNSQLWTFGAAILVALVHALAHGQPAQAIPPRVFSINTEEGKSFRRASAPNAAVFTNYHSWDNVVSLTNGIVEAVVVPSIGRVQQFRFVGDTNGAFWENRPLFGRTASGYYSSFGGDKAWPSPQSDWNWPPPKGFDGSAFTVTVTNGLVNLISPVDPTYKIRVTRTISLVANLPVMIVSTTFERTMATGRDDKELGIWIDCQASVTADSRCYVPVPSPSIFTNGYTTSGSSVYTTSLPLAFTNTGGVISFGRDPRAYHKLGFDSGTLALVGPNLSLRIDEPKTPGAAYPDGDSSTEIYTADGRNSFVELEMMGRLEKLPAGEKMEFYTVYSLFRRTEPTPEAEAKKVLSWQF